MISKSYKHISNADNNVPKAKHLLLAAVSCAALCFTAAPSHAQSIDFTSMEELFGEPVTTSATGKPQRMSEVPVTMEILTQDDIRRSGAVNLAEALRQVNGVNVIQRTEEQYDVSIRGYNQSLSQRLLVLVNGRQVYLDQYGYTNWNSIPVQMQEIRQIEVVKGPNTALFGFNAVNGVINIVTYNPLYDDESSVGVTVGTGDYFKGHFVHSFKLNDKIGTRISVGGLRSDTFDNDFNSAFAGSQLVQPRSQSFNIDTIAQVNDQSQLRIELSGNNNEAPELIDLGVVNSRYKTRAAKVSYEVDSDYGLIKANLYKNFLDWKVVGFQVSEAENEILVAQLENTIQVHPDHTVRVQGEYRENELSGTFQPNGEISYQVFALSGMWNWRIRDNLSWTNAVRGDRLVLDFNGGFTSGNPFTLEDYDQTINELSYNSGLVWQATDQDTFRLNTARGLEIPSLIEFGFDFTFGPFFLGGSPRLDPAVVTNYELAWDRQIDSIDGLFRAAAFYNRTQDVKAVDAVSVGLTNRFSDNIGDSSSFGIELEVEGKLNDKINWGVGYIYQEINDDLENGRSEIGLTANKDFEGRNPQHHVNLELGYTDGPWEADTLVYYVSSSQEFVAPPASLGTYLFEDIDSYVGANARVGYTFDNDVTIAAHGQQLLRPQTQTSVTPDIDRRLFFSVSTKF